FSQDAGEASVCAWVGLLLTEDSCWVDGPIVGANADPGLSEGKTHVVLVHHEVGGSDVVLIFEKKIEQRVIDVFLPQLGDLSDSLTFKGFQLGVADTQDQDTRCPTGT